MHTHTHTHTHTRILAIWRASCDPAFTQQGGHYTQSHMHICTSFFAFLSCFLFPSRPFSISFPIYHVPSFARPSPHLLPSPLRYRPIGTRGGETEKGPARHRDGEGDLAYRLHLGVEQWQLLMSNRCWASGLQGGGGVCNPHAPTLTHTLKFKSNTSKIRGRNPAGKPIYALAQ